MAGLRNYSPFIASCTAPSSFIFEANKGPLSVLALRLKICKSSAQLRAHQNPPGRADVMSPEAGEWLRS